MEGAASKEPSVPTSCGGFGKRSRFRCRYILLLLQNAVGAGGRKGEVDMAGEGRRAKSGEAGWSGDCVVAANGGW